MNSSTTEERAVKRRRLTVAELTEILDSVAANRKHITVKPLAPLECETGNNKRRDEFISKPKKRFSKVKALGAVEKILALVDMNPEWGTQRLAKSLADQGISTSRQYIHTILIKYNLNQPAMRKAWKANQKEMKP